MTITTTGLSLLEVREKYPECFYKQNWYNTQVFASDKPETGTYEFDFRSRYCGNTYAEQLAALRRMPQGYVFPHPAVLAEALCIHFKETGERLLSDWYSRTSLLDSDGYRVSVGPFDADGLSVDGSWDGHRSSRLGVSASRKTDAGMPEPLETSGILESLIARVEKLEAFQKRTVELLPSLEQKNI